MKKVMHWITALILMSSMGVGVAQPICTTEPDLSSVFGASKLAVSKKSVKNTNRLTQTTAYEKTTSLYPAVVTKLTGSVILISRNGQILNQSLTIGSQLQRGDVVETGRQSFITFVLASGVTSSLPSNTKVALQQASSSVARYDLLQGRIENRVIKKPNAKRNTFEVTVPNGILGVRGTHFLVTHDVQSGVSALSVKQGVVVVKPLKSCSVPLVVQAEQSTLIKEAFSESDVKTSLEAPEWGASKSQRDDNLLFEVAPVIGAKAYVAQVARDEGFLDVILEGEASDNTNIVIPSHGLSDGFYYARFGTIDEQGINGYGRSYLFLRNIKD